MVSAAELVETGRAVPFVPRLRLARQPVHAALIWLTAASSPFVFIEPSPYELSTLLTMVVFIATGLTLRAGLVPLAGLLAVINVGFATASVPLFDKQEIVIWLLTSCYMAMTALFFAAMLNANTQERLAFLTRGYVIAGILASLAAVAGYFHLIPHADALLLEYSRARGTFKDPNVLGAFLVFPGLVCLQRVLLGGPKDILFGTATLLLIAAAILLSFSRAAWGQFAFTSALMMGLMFVTTRSNRARTRIVVLAFVGVAMIALFIAALLSIDAVKTLFTERARLEQDYDSGQMGRFGRHVLGALLALDMPFGIGPLQFSHYFPEDTHNSYLNAFMSGGWLSGVVYPTLIAVTFVYGLRLAFTPTPWRSMYLAYFSAFVGTALESFIIDTDHWRHYFLLIGVIWGLNLAARRPIPVTPPAAPQPRVAVITAPAGAALAPSPGG